MYYAVIFLGIIQSIPPFVYFTSKIKVEVAIMRTACWHLWCANKQYIWVLGNKAQRCGSYSVIEEVDPEEQQQLTDKVETSLSWYAETEYHWEISNILFH